MWSWLSKIDPNIVLPVLSGIGSWVWHKIRNDGRASTSNIALAVLKNFGEELLARYSNEDIESYLKTSRSYIENRVWSVLAKRGVSKSSSSQKIVDHALEETTAWLASEIRKTRASGK